MMDVQRTYLPAAGHNWSLPLYDPLVRLLGADTARRALLDQAALLPNYRVLDVGCGTGTLAILIKRLYPSTEVIGFDPDPKALTQARRKAARASVSIRFEEGFSDELPYPEESFDRVFSSFMFHHLQADDREKMLREIRRVLRPQGSLHMLDFEVGAHKHGPLAHLLHSSDRLKDNSEGRILTLITRAGFGNSKKVMEGAMLFGHLRIGYYQASTDCQ